MDGNTELLNYVYQNAQMGERSTAQLTELSESPKFREHLQTQNREYESIRGQARDLLRQSGHEEKDINGFAKMSLYMSIGTKTLTDKSASHMAEMMMRGSTMGIIDVSKNLKKYAGADPEAVSLAEKLLRTEEANVEHIKAFLS